MENHLFLVSGHKSPVGPVVISCDRYAECFLKNIVGDRCTGMYRTYNAASESGIDFQQKITVSVEIVKKLYGDRATQ